MSAHVIRALNMAQKAGYEVDVNFREIEQDYTDMSGLRSSSLYDLDIISALSEAGSVQNYSDIIDFIEKEIKTYENIADSITRVNKPKSRLFGRRWGWHETYRESFKDRTVIFCENLPQGTYTFNIELIPRYTGRYSLNPAKAEMMYFPVINSNNGLRRVDIKIRDLY